MAHTVDAVIYDPDALLLVMQVIPDDDAELDDPSFNPLGLIQVRVAHLDNIPPVNAALSQGLIPMLINMES